MRGQRSLPRRVSRPTILVVDDDEALRESLDLILGDAYRVVEAADGRAALAALASRRVDAVVLDILLPGADGLEVLREIRGTDAAVPVIMLTGVRTVVTAVEAMRLGAFDYVTKPFDGDALLGVVARALARGARAGRDPATGAVASRAVARRVACLLVGGSPGWRAALRLLLDRRGIDAVTLDGSGDRLDGHLDQVRAVVLGPGHEGGPVAAEVRRRQAAGDSIVALTAHGDVVDGLGPRGAERSAAEPSADDDGHIARVVARVERGIGRSASTPRISGHVGRGIEYLAAHYAEGVTLAAVADALGISESHFAHTFQSEVGLAPKLFLTRLRLDVATALLAGGDRMADVARRVGLFDGSHLSRLLRRHAADGRPMGPSS